MTIKDSGELKMTPGKRGPKPKQLQPVEKEGLPVGRDNVVIPPIEVQKLAALGCKNIEIANFFGVNGDAISRNFAPELLKGREDMKISLRRAMLNNAVSNMNATMQIWLSKQYLNMGDNGVTDSEDNAPLPWQD